MWKSNKFDFEDEINKVVRFIRKTLKRKEEMFLHLLLCNSSDALHELVNCRDRLFIKIISNKINNTLTIVDNGVGMTKEDLLFSLDFIARSTTKDLAEDIADADDVTMMDQFGFGFYFAFLVADKVVFRTKHDYHQQYVWEWQAGGPFTLTRDTSAHSCRRGSSITLYLKEDQLEYLEEPRLNSLIKKHSCKIQKSFSISVCISKPSDIEIPLVGKDRREKMMLEMANVKPFHFQADINKLVSFICKTFQSNKEIFLHLLICNSSYALYKLYYQTLEYEDGLSITIIPDKTNNTLTIVDNGAGMTKDDLMDDMASSARASTIKLAEDIAAGTLDVNKVEQCGFGFYFAYLVADKVVVRTKHNNDEQYVWEWQKGGPFTLTRDTSAHYLVRGSRMTLYLKEDQLEYLEERRLMDLIEKHSCMIRYPIYLSVEKTSDISIRWKKKMRKAGLTECRILRIV